MELVVVLGILAVVASVTVSMIGDATEEPRVEKTTQLGNAVRDAVEGDGGGATRFISDMGRLPIVISVDEGKVLAEIFDAALVNSNVKTGLVSFDFTGAGAWPETGTAWSSLPGGTDVSLQCGWSGPYYYTGTDIVDGWGNDWQIQKSDGTWKDAAAGDTIYGIRSLGSDSATGGSSWNENDLEFAFEEELAKCSLTVFLMVKEELYADSPLTPPQGADDVSSLGDWAAGHSYSAGDEIKESGYRFRCISVAEAYTGSSGSSAPAWNTSSVGDETTDNQLVWEYLGTGDGSKTDWVASTNYAVGDERDYGSSPYYNFRCKRIIPHSGSSEPVWVKTAGARTADNHIVWKCMTGTSRMNRLRVAVFYPDIDDTKKKLGRKLAQSELTISNVEWNPSNSSVTFKKELGLAPGSRKLYAYGFYEINTGEYINKFQSSVLDVNLKPGSNQITIYLTSSLD